MILPNSSTMGCYYCQFQIWLDIGLDRIITLGLGSNLGSDLGSALGSDLASDLKSDIGSDLGSDHNGKVKKRERKIWTIVT